MTATLNTPCCGNPPLNPNSKRKHVQRNYRLQKPCISDTNSTTLAILIVVRKNLALYKRNLYPWALQFSRCAETWITGVVVHRSASASSGVIIQMTCRCPVHICTYPVKTQPTIKTSTSARKPGTIPSDPNRNMLPHTNRYAVLYK